MTWTDEAHQIEGMTQRHFTLDGANGPVPGVSWSPIDGPADRLLLLGHGGTLHKKVEYIQLVAQYAVTKGFQAVAIDGPGHGERAFPDIEQDDDWFVNTWHRGGGTDGIVADWEATVTFMEQEHSPRPTAWWGLSMGTMMGLPVVVNDRRISVSVLGLMGGWGPNADDLTRLAPKLDRPLRFLLQWDDEVVPRAQCLDLFDKIGSERKTLHANPGLHANVPEVEVVSSIDYLDQYLK